jgi:hypothetical protein
LKATYRTFSLIQTDRNKTKAVLIETLDVKPEHADGVYADLIKVFLPSGKIDLKHLTASYGKKDPATLHDYLLRLLVREHRLVIHANVPRRVAFAGEVTQKLRTLERAGIPEVKSSKSMMQ